MISKKTAEYFLELDDRYKILLVKDTLQNKTIAILRNTVTAQQEVIGTFESDKILWQELEATLQAKISLSSEQQHNLKRELRKWKLRTYGIIVLDVVIIILIILA